MMKEYETIFVLEANFDEASVEQEIDKIREIVTGNGGEVVAVEKWGRRKLAYEIRKKKEGIYVLIRFKAEPSVLPIIGRRYELHEHLLRHIIVLYEAPPVDSGAGMNPGFNTSAAVIEG